MTDVTVTLRAIHDLIATTAGLADRNPAEIRLVAVSKTHPVSGISEALAAKQHDFAENYLQEATAKIQTLAGTAAIWHFIGRVQGNKTRAIASLFDWVQTVDRLRIAQRLDNHRSPDQPPLNVCVQVRLSDDPQRPGAPPAEVPDLVTAIEKLPRLRLRGLMCMPPLEADPDNTREHFDRVRTLYDSLRADGHALDTLSMGTTADMAAAIAAGSTMIRVGTAIFGPRR